MAWVKGSGMVAGTAEEGTYSCMMHSGGMGKASGSAGKDTCLMLIRTSLWPLLKVIVKHSGVGMQH